MSTVSIMNKLEYRKHFSEYHQGYAGFLHIMSAPVLPLNDPPLTEQGLDDFHYFNQLAKKRQALTLVLQGEHVPHKATLMTQFCYLQQKPLWLIASEQLHRQPGSEVARLFAKAELASSILFFDDADALFKGIVDHQRPQQVEQFERLLNYTLSHVGLAIFSISNPKVCAFLRLRIKHAILLP